MYRLHLSANAVVVFLADGQRVWPPDIRVSPSQYQVMDVATLKEAIELFSFSSAYPMAQASLWVLELTRAKIYLRHH